MSNQGSYLDYYWINFGFFAAFSTRIFVLTWSFVFIYSIHDLSWARTISKCAILCSVMSLGYALGSIFLNIYIGKLARLVIFRWAVLSLCLLILAVSTKFSIICVICGVIGIIVGSTTSSITKHLRNRSVNAIEFPSPLNIDEISISNLKYQTLSLCFGPLFIILLYDTNYDVKFPALLPALVYAWFFVAVLVYYLKLSKKCSNNGKYSGVSSDDYVFSDEDALEEGVSVSSNVHANANASGANTKYTSVALTSTKPIEYPSLNYEESDGPVPTCFIDFHQDARKSRDAYTNMLRWRAVNDVDHMMDRPFKNYAKVLKFYPSYVHGRAKDGCILAYEQIGKANMVGLLDAGSSVEDVVYMVTLRNEILIKKYSPDNPDDNPDPLYCYYCTNRLKFISILDCEGVSMSNLNVSDMIKYIVLSSYITDQYFPGLVRCILIINTSYAFQYLWGMVVIALPESVKNKIAFPKDLKSGLDEFIEPSQRPSVYGGTDPKELGQSEEHLAFMKVLDGWKDMALSSDSSNADKVTGNVSTSTADGPRDGVTSRDSADADADSGWFSKLFGRKSLNSRDASTGAGASTHTEAYLGAENSFIYDKESETWIFAPTDSETGSSSGVFGNRNGNDNGIAGEKPPSMDSDSSYSSSSSSYSSSESSLDSDSDADEEKGLLSRNRNSEKTKAKANNAHRTNELDPDESVLVLAIEAAHYAKANASTLKSTSPYADRSDRTERLGLESPMSGGGSSIGLSARRRGANSNSNNSAIAMDKPPRHPSGSSPGLSSGFGSSDAYSNHGMGNGIGIGSESKQDVSIHMLILVCMFQILASCMYYGLLFIIPAYLLTPFSSGGLNYTLIDLGLTMSTVGFLLYSFSILSLRPKCHLFLKSSPVRAMRIAMVVLIIMLVLLPLMNNASLFANTGSVASTPSATANGHSNGISVDDDSTYMDRHYPTHIIYQAHSDAHRQHTHLSLMSILNNTPLYLIPIYILYGLLFSIPPSCSVLGMVVPSMIITTIVTSGYMGKKASTIITYVTLQNTSFEATTHALIDFLDAISATMAPLLMAGIYGSTYHLHLAYPRDASFVLFVMILFALLLYISTLLIHVQFRGDFGILIDQPMSATQTQHNNNNTNNTNNNANINDKYINMLLDTMRNDIQVVKAIYLNKNGGSSNSGIGIGIGSGVHGYNGMKSNM